MVLGDDELVVNSGVLAIYTAKIGQLLCSVGELGSLCVFRNLLSDILTNQRNSSMEHSSPSEVNNHRANEGIYES
jgi:hypothetical protein